LPDNPELAALRAQYRLVFSTDVGKLVLKDLRRFCRADKSTHLPDDPTGRNSANLEGRRAPVLYIEAMRSETDDLLRALNEK
jgi:hypothetical protein